MKKFEKKFIETLRNDEKREQSIRSSLKSYKYFTIISYAMIVLMVGDIFWGNFNLDRLFMYLLFCLIIAFNVENEIKMMRLWELVKETLDSEKNNKPTP